MTKLVLLALAASAAALPAAAAAQVVTSPGPVAGGTGATFVHSAPHIQRGFFIPPMWWGPQFHVQNWQVYGLAQPAADQRWVRYYNDAYLVDQRGRVVDTRTGLDWDQGGERWVNQGGIPQYVGNGQWQPGAQDYAWFQQHGYGPGPYPGYAGYGAPGAPGNVTTTTYGGPAGCGTYTYGGCYGGYGYGVAYPIVIETTVTGGCGCCCTPTVTYETVEEVVEVRPAPRRRTYRPAPRPRPRPPAGERG